MSLARRFRVQTNKRRSKQTKVVMDSSPCLRSPQLDSLLIQFTCSVSPRTGRATLCGGAKFDRPPHCTGDRIIGDFHPPSKARITCYSRQFQRPPEPRPAPWPHGMAAPRGTGFSGRSSGARVAAFGSLQLQIGGRKAGAAG